MQKDAIILKLNILIIFPSKGLVPPRTRDTQGEIVLLLQLIH